jgi:hypothetical protein
MRRTVAIALCTLAVGGTACAKSVTPPWAPNVHRHIPETSGGVNQMTKVRYPFSSPGVDLHSPTAVAIAEVRTTWTLKTTSDLGWYAGELAACAYMTPSYAASIRSHPPQGAPGSTWMIWAAHRATTSVTASAEADPGGPSDTALTAYLKITATVTPHGTAGWVGQPEIWVTYLVASRTSPGAPWEIAATETTP